MGSAREQMPFGAVIAVQAICLDNLENIMTVLPAYGRDYKSKDAVLADWLAGKDFKDAITGQYLSIRDKLPEVWIRYDKLRKQVKATNA